MSQSRNAGAIPFDPAAETGKWWAIDSTGSAYGAVRENITTLRAEGGLPALYGRLAQRSRKCAVWVLCGRHPVW